jgi:predicted alpha/beta-fold hydrolase
MKSCHRPIRPINLLVLLPLLAGCFSEGSFPMVETELTPFPVRDVVMSRRPDTMSWVEAYAPRLEPRLPAGQRGALTRSTVVLPDGATIDVMRHFHTSAANVDNIFGNYRGLAPTAQVIPADENEDAAINWIGFEPVQIRMRDQLPMVGYLAAPTRRPIPGSYIVITHGLFGSQAGHDAHNVADAMRALGHHVLAVEMRGHGATGKLNPQYPILFGAGEVDDLLTLSRWLRQEQHATRVGLISFCITAQEAMAAAWVDGGGAATENEDSPIIRSLPRPDALPAYNGGIVAICPPMNLISYADSLETRHNIFQSPVRSTFENRVAARFAAFGRAPETSMWKYVSFELSRSARCAEYANDRAFLTDTLSFIDFSGDGWKTGARRLEHVRTPLLVIHAANDPLGSAQATTEVLSRVSNRNVGYLLLPGGGHMGFSALSAPYYYSVLRAFFDPETCPQPHLPVRVAFAEQATAL